MSREHVGWGQKLVRAPRRFKGVQDGVYRVMILDEKSEHGFTHYLGEYIACLGRSCPACKAGIRKDERYGFNIISYDLDAGGAIKNPVTYKILPWIVSWKVFGALQELYAMNGAFWNYDLKLICTGAKFQAWQIVAYREAAWAQITGLKDAVMRDYQTQAHDIAKVMGRTVTEAEMLELARQHPPEDADFQKPQGSPPNGQQPKAAGAATKTEAQLFGGGAKQVQNLVGSVIDSALSGKVTPPPTTVISGNTQPPAENQAFPAPISVDSVAESKMEAKEPPTPGPSLPGSTQSPGFTDLVSKLKALDKKQP